jgi:predicted DNA-binding transcriptional regulator AlpA
VDDNDTQKSLLMTKKEVCAHTHRSYPTIWQAIRRGEFPRGRVQGGMLYWFRAEVDAYLANMPVQRIKGDAA